LEEDALTLEQALQLRQLQDQLRTCSREELMDMILEAHEKLLVERHWFRVVMEAAGIETSERGGDFQPLPETEEEVAAVFGRVPSTEELAAYMNERMEAARMDDVDIEAIALGLED
jgi:hypothetical protein